MQRQGIKDDVFFFWSSEDMVKRKRDFSYDPLRHSYPETYLNVSPRKANI